MNDSRRQQGPRPPTEWIEVKDFVDTRTALVVRVSRSSGQRPRYTYRDGRLNLEDAKKVAALEADAEPFFPRLIPFIGLEAEIHNGVVEVLDDCLSDLKSAAREFVRAELQDIEDEKLAEQTRREKAQNDRQKPKQAAGLKELAKRDKRAWENREKLATPPAMTAAAATEAPPVTQASPSETAAG